MVFLLVVVDRLLSNWTSVLSGILQSLVLGPLLFIIYINDLVDSCYDNDCLQCFDAVGWAAGRASGL